jgi:insulysin
VTSLSFIKVKPTTIGTIQILFLLIMLSLVSGCTEPLAIQKNTNPNPANTIIKSSTDTRDYLAFTLDNQLQVLVISDPEADKAAASLSVSVGSGSDPKTREGLAHFLEHMLFLGTQKYPEAGAYQRFINEQGGSHNAYTAFDETNYFFDINAEHLAPALNQFAQFFIAPLFNEDLVEREKHAVNSEYQAKIKDDNRLQYDVLKAVSNPAHPFTQFSVGSLNTLANRDSQPIRDDLLSFYQQHYSANLMALVVLGKQPIDELHQLVIEKFTAVKNHHSAEPRFTQPLFKENQLPLRVNTLPNKNLRRLNYHFPVPNSHPHINSKPVHYISNLLGHEGQGSLLSYLKNRGWADGLSAGLGFEDNQQAQLQVSINVTEQGLKKTTEITTALFQSIALIQQQGIERWRFEEQAQLAKLDFEFQENSDNMHYVSHLASQLKQIPTPQLLSAPYQMTAYDPQLINQYLSALRADNMLMMVVAKDLPVNHTTERFNASYGKQPIDNEQLAQWQKPTLNNDIKLPAANPFIPSQLSLIQSPAVAQSNPQPLPTTSGINTWHSPDTHFKTPKANVFFTLRSPLANQSALNTALTALYVKSINEQLNEFSYPAALAGLNYQLYPHVRGVSVRLSGYQDKQPRLLKEILAALANPTIKASSFARHKDELRRGWQNTAKQTPYQQSLARTANLVTSPSWPESELLTALQTISATDLRQFANTFLMQLDIEVLANGNISRNATTAMTEQISRQLTGHQKARQVARPQIKKLPEQQKLLYQFNVDHTDNAVTLYVQGSDKHIDTHARFALLNQMISTPFYHELRTRQQLGYIVFCSPMSLIDAPALTFTVQSPNTSGMDIVGAMEAFITDFSDTLNNMNETTLTLHKKALTGQIMAKDSRLTQRSNRYWHEIDRNNVNFNTREQLVTAIESIDLETLKNNYRQDFIMQPRQLVTMAVGKDSAKETIPDTYQQINTAELSQLTSGYIE